jgi:hypothetical protein
MATVRKCLQIPLSTLSLETAFTSWEISAVETEPTCKLANILDFDIMCMTY